MLYYSENADGDKNISYQIPKAMFWWSMPNYIQSKIKTVISRFPIRIQEFRKKLKQVADDDSGFNVNYMCGLYLKWILKMIFISIRRWETKDFKHTLFVENVVWEVKKFEAWMFNKNAWTTSKSFQTKGLSVIWDFF